MTLKISYKSLKILQTSTITKLNCGYVFAFDSNYGYILHNLRDKAIFRSKIVIFSYPLHSTLRFGEASWNIPILLPVVQLQ